MWIVRKLTSPRRVRLGNRRGRQEAWFLIKGHDEHERSGVDALALEAEIPPPDPGERATPPAEGAVRGPLPKTQGPQLCTIAAAPPEEPGWISEIKLGCRHRTDAGFTLSGTDREY